MLTGEKSVYSYFMVGVVGSITDLKAAGKLQSQRFFWGISCWEEKQANVWLVGRTSQDASGREAGVRPGSQVLAGTTWAVFSDLDPVSKMDQVQNYLLHFHLSKMGLHV